MLGNLRTPLRIRLRVQKKVGKYKLKEALAAPLLLNLSVCSYISDLEFPSIKAARQDFFFF